MSPVRAVSLGPVLPRAMRGNAPAVAMQTIEGFQVRNAEASKQFEQMYTASKDPLIQAAGRETFEAVAILQAIQRRPYTPPPEPIIRAGDSARACSRSPS